jgi:hypothetical protein
METTLGNIRFRGGLAIIMMATIFIMAHASVVHSQPKDMLSYFKNVGAGAAFLGPEGWYNSDISVEIVKPQNVVYLRYTVTDGNVQFTGQGFIPTEAFKVDGHSGSAFLDTDTTTIQDFSAFRCASNSDGYYECAPDHGGAIHMEWVGNGYYREEILSKRMMFSSFQSGPTIQHDDVWVVTANAHGVMLGYNFASPLDAPSSASVSGYSERLR